MKIRNDLPLNVLRRFNAHTVDDRKFEVGCQREVLDYLFYQGTFSCPRWPTDVDTASRPRFDGLRNKRGKLVPFRISADKFRGAPILRKQLACIRVNCRACGGRRRTRPGSSGCQRLTKEPDSMLRSNRCQSISEPCRRWCPIFNWWYIFIYASVNKNGTPCIGRCVPFESADVLLLVVTVDRGGDVPPFETERFDVTIRDLEELLVPRSRVSKSTD